ncbi:hypothetical protein EMIT0P171_80053 [Pseudomonas sp. IT-P171]
MPSRSDKASFSHPLIQNRSRSFLSRNARLNSPDNYAITRILIVMRPLCNLRTLMSQLNTSYLSTTAHYKYPSLPANFFHCGTQVQTLYFLTVRTYIQTRPTVS